MNRPSFNVCETLLERHIRATPKKVAVLDTGATTYEELGRLRDSYGNGLLALDVAAGDRVVLVLPDSVGLVAVLLAAISIGAVPMVIAPTAGAADVSRACDLVAPSVVVAERTSDQTTAGEHTVDLELLGARGGWPMPKLSVRPVGGEDPALLLLTSGSTGIPKAVVHTHGSLSAGVALWESAEYGERFGQCCDDTYYSLARLSSAYGTAALLFCLSAGATAVLDPVPPDPLRAIQIIRDREPSVVYALPSFFSFVLKSERLQHELASCKVRKFVSAGEALLPAVETSLRELVDGVVVNGLGTAETWCAISQTESVSSGLTLGTPVPGYEVELRDASGRPVQGEPEGFAYVRSDAAARSFWNDPAATEKKFVDGWVNTGDLLARHGDGDFTYSGRGDDQLKIRGQIVVPTDVESFVALVDGVVESCFVGASDAQGLLRGVLFVRARPGAETSRLAAQIRRRARRELPRAMVPSLVECVADLPRNRTGKLDRNALADRAHELLVRNHAPGDRA